MHLRYEFVEDKLILSSDIKITEVLNFAVRMVSDVETNIVSVERVKEYTETPTEVIHSSNIRH